jgi:hypothetical protein
VTVFKLNQEVDIAVGPEIRPQRRPENSQTPDMPFATKICDFIFV